MLVSTPRQAVVEVPGVKGLFLAGSTVESPAAVVDIGAWAGRSAAHAALALLG